MFKANVLYDFDAQTELGEIDIKVGEVVSVTSQDAGEGWYKGTNAKGEHGLFPKDFVEPCDSKYNTSVSSSSLRPQLRVIKTYIFEILVGFGPRKTKPLHKMPALLFMWNLRAMTRTVMLMITLKRLL